MFYDVVQEYNLGALTHRMDYKLRMGWRPLGGLTVTAVGGQVYYTQALIKD